MKRNGSNTSPAWFDKIIYCVIFIAILWVIHGVNIISQMSLSEFGLRPRSINGLIGVITMPLLHSSWGHLASNSFPLLVLTLIIVIVFQSLILKSTVIIWILSGLITWCIAEEGSVHVGASGLVYGYAFFVFWSGLGMKKRRYLAISFIVILWYGSMIWGIFPFGVKESTSWEGHLSGALAGTGLALFLFRKNFFAKPKPVSKEPHFFEKHPIDLD